MAYGWNTRQRDGQFYWSVYSVEHLKTTTLVEGTCPSRGRAIAAAKKAVMRYRRPAKRPDDMPPRSIWHLV
jgi:hypothetical protein